MENWTLFWFSRAERQGLPAAELRGSSRGSSTAQGRSRQGKFPPRQGADPPVTARLDPANFCRRSLRGCRNPSDLPNHRPRPPLPGLVLSPAPPPPAPAPAGTGMGRAGKVSQPPWPPQGRPLPAAALPGGGRDPRPEPCRWLTMS